VTAPVARLMETTITPAAPFRVISLSGRSGYSASSKGWRPFEIATDAVDRLYADQVIERTADLSYFDPKDPRAKMQLVRGIASDGWMTQEASVLVKVPRPVHAVRVRVYIPDDAPARTVTLMVDGQVLAEDTFPRPGAFSLVAPFHTDASQATVGVRVDKTHVKPPDQRELGLVITGIGLE
jgi:hypothetical protein